MVTPNKENGPPLSFLWNALFLEKNLSASPKNGNTQ